MDTHTHAHTHTHFFPRSLAHSSLSLLSPLLSSPPLQMWLQGGKTEPRWRKMYDDAMDGMSALLLRRTKPSGLLYVGQLHGRSFRPAMEHLACFVGGMLALGAKSSTDFQSARAQRDWKHAKGIAYTCFNVRPGERERE
jgi:hypothetical protein